MLTEIGSRCRDCDHWTPVKLRAETGACSKLPHSPNVFHFMSGGWGGRKIDKIETSESFYCGEFKVKERI